jgi:hypothetical protein
VRYGLSNPSPMVWLPQEIVANIATFLPDPQQPDGIDHCQKPKFLRSRLATVSRQWQRAIEPLNFQSLHITSEDLEAFISAFSSTSSSRRSLLKELHFDIVLPDYNDDACAKYETAEDRDRNSAAASSCMSALLEELSKWPSHGHLNLVIDIYAPTDSSHRTAAERSEDLHAVDMGRRRDLFGDRYRYSYIRLSDTNYPLVSCVASLSPPQGDRFLEPSSLVALASAFPRVETLSWSYRDPGFFVDPRRRHMQQFAEAMDTYQVPSTATTFYLTIESPEYPHPRRVPNLAGPASGGSMCDALRRLIGRSSLHKFWYQGPIDPSLFWPDKSETTDAEWRSLRDVWIYFDMASLSGEWLFKGLPDDEFYHMRSDMPLPWSTGGIAPPGYGSEEDTAAALVKSMEAPSDSEGFAIDGLDFRRIPRDEAMLPLLEAIARRLSRTPSLRTLYLETTLPQSRGLWFFSYAAPGEFSGYEEYMEEFDADLLRARVFIHTEDWRPDQKVVSMLRDIGKMCYGQESIVTFLPFLF